MVGQRDRVHLVHDLHVEQMRRNAVLVDDELFEAGDGEVGRTEQTFGPLQLLVVVGELSEERERKKGREKK